MVGNIKDTISFVCQELEKRYSEREISALLENQEQFNVVVNEILILKSKREYLAENSSGLDSAAKKIQFVSGLMEAIRNPELIYEAGIPHYSTGINVLEDLLKKIVPILETDYKKLTTDKKQRISFKEHILNATINALKSPRMYQSQEQNITMGETPPLGDGSVERSKKLEDENANFAQLEKEPEAIGSIDDSSKKIEIKKGDRPDAEEYEMFLLPDQDKTGANVAYASFKKIGRMITDAFQVLDNESDKDTFYEFLIANIKLYLDRFEEELVMDLPPEKQEQVDAIQEQPEVPAAQQTNDELAGLDIQPSTNL